jgi:hypothetical protein
MIIEAKIISQPYSGEYSERIYDNESAWNSQNWTFIRFMNDDYSEWCGQFRGFPENVGVSTTRNIVLVLTSDYLYQLDRETGNLTELDAQPQYHSLTTTPNGDFVLAYNYSMEKVTTSINQKTTIESPIRMDRIEFKNWKNAKL